MKQGSSMSCTCVNCRERRFCIVDVYNEVRHREISSVDEGDSAELAVDVLRGREEFFRLLRQNLEKQLRLYAGNDQSPES